MSEEITYTISKPEPIKTIEFNLGNKAFGRLRATDDGRLEFEGDVECSAKLFFDYLCSNFQAFHDSAAQSELAALREELENRTNRVAELAQQRNDLQQRLADAERRNAECIALLRRSTADKGQDLKAWWNDRALILQAALKPTESGASE